MDIAVKNNNLPGYPRGAVDISTARQDCQFKLCSIYSDQEINDLLQACQGTIKTCVGVIVVEPKASFQVRSLSIIIECVEAAPLALH